MPTHSAEVVRISSPGDVIVAAGRMLGFVPARSLVAICTRGRRGRLCLVMRYDLDAAGDIDRFEDELGERSELAGADGVVIAVFSDDPPVGGTLPHRGLVERVGDRLGDRMIDLLLVAGGRWWSYLCADPRCCGPDGTEIDLTSPGATALAAAYTLFGLGVLPDRDALVRSVGYDGHNTATRIGLIADARRRHAGQSRQERRRAVRALVMRLTDAQADPRILLADADAVELSTYCDDVVVRDEVLVCAVDRKRREELLQLLNDAARRIPAPHDAAICATLAWVSYASGNGALANIALDRALGTDPDYSLALLTAESLERQVPPRVLEVVMREAEQDLRSPGAAG